MGDSRGEQSTFGRAIISTLYPELRSSRLHKLSSPSVPTDCADRSSHPIHLSSLHTVCTAYLGTYIGASARDMVNGLGQGLFLR